MSKKDLTIELIFEKARTIYYNGCSDEDFEFARGLILPQSIIPFSTPLELQNNKRTNSVGIVSENDKFLSPDYQRLMHKKAGCKIRSIASGHAPFFSIFSQLAEMLSEN
jgi:predicted alpha/beta hydrolase family esterase